MKSQIFMTFNVFGFTPGGAERLGGDLDVDVLDVAQVQVPLGMLIGAAFRRDDHDLAADVTVDER